MSRSDTGRLIQGLKSEDYGARRTSAAELGKLKAKEAVPELLNLLSDPNWDVRKSCAQALGEIGEKEAVSGLIGLLQDRDWFVRETAAISLGKLGDRTAIAKLMRSLEDEVYSVRKASASALRELGVKLGAGESVKQPQEAGKAGVKIQPREEVPSVKEKKDCRARVISVAKELGAGLTTVKDGFQLSIEVGKGRHQKLYVWFKGGQIIYETGCGPATPENYLWGLRANYEMECGSLTVRDLKGEPTFVVIERQLAEWADMEEIRKAIWSIATFADWAEESLTGEDKR